MSGRRRRSHPVDGDVGLDALLVLLLRLVAHLLDQPAQLGIEVVPVDPARRLADVAAQVGRALDLGSQLEHRCDLAQIARHRRLERQQHDRLLLQVRGLGRRCRHRCAARTRRPRGPAAAGCRCTRGSARPRTPRAGRPRCAAPRAHCGNRGRKIDRHQPNLPVTYSSVRSSSGFENTLAVGLYSTSTPGATIALVVDLGREERRAVADPGGLLHVVGDDHDRVLGARSPSSAPRCVRWRSGRAPSTARPSGSRRARRRRNGRCRAAAAGRRTAPAPMP